MSIQILNSQDAKSNLSEVDLEWLRLHAKFYAFDLPLARRQSLVEFSKDYANMTREHAVGILDVDRMEIIADEEAGFIYVITNFMNHEHWLEELECVVKGRIGYITSDIVGLTITQAYSYDMLSTIRDSNIYAHINACRCIYNA